MGACNDFKPFTMDTEVCDNCGELVSGHPRSAESVAEPDGLTAALWAVLLEIGGCWDYYGGGFVRAERRGPHANEMAQVQDHMKQCAIDWRQTARPTMDGELLEFAGTESDSNKITGKLFGSLYCKCGEVGRYPRSEEIGCDDITLGQLIWRVTNATV